MRPILLPCFACTSLAFHYLFEGTKDFHLATNAPKVFVHARIRSREWLRANCVLPTLGLPHNTSGGGISRLRRESWCAI